MAIKIPNKAFLSFSYKQCVDTMWRAGKQIEDSWDSSEKRTVALKYIADNLKTLHKHEEPKVSELAQKLEDYFPKDPKSMQDWLMILERLMKKDLRDSDFLVSTIDEFDKAEIAISPIHLVLDNLRSSFNVGSLFRTAEALGIEMVHLCGYTPTPENSKTAKSALGTDKWVKWKSWESTLECLEYLKEQGHTIYAFETEANATSLLDIKPEGKSAIILGNERYGLSAPVLKRADELVKITLHGKKNSLNVGICGAMAIYHFVENS
ncbi:RNA methyltransferase [Halobacteriovorax sp. HLS]|uniref:RNA methyltransferase n=1 Tax=Halobacteriovorax sp. HLS TaxID=2234000 RepID=UPI000FD91D77|nr:RNA methyltransferase [Halobacteriovorax sp. HLS]